MQYMVGIIETQHNVSHSQFIEKFSSKRKCCMQRDNYLPDNETIGNGSASTQIAG